MYSPSQLRRQVDTLIRRYSVELAEYKLPLLAKEYRD